MIIKKDSNYILATYQPGGPLTDGLAGWRLLNITKTPYILFTIRPTTDCRSFFQIDCIELQIHGAVMIIKKDSKALGNVPTGRSHVLVY